MKDFLKKIYFEAQYLLKAARPIRPIILMYHRVAKEENDPHLLCVSPENFSEHLKYLAEWRKIVTLRDITNADCPQNAAAITFDDGYADNLHAALPILKKFAAPATIFVTAGFLGKKFPWDNEFSSGRALSEKELATLSEEELVEIGAHTMTHPRLAELPEGEQRKEILESKAVIETIAGKPVFSFAYPFGSFTGLSADIARQCGFQRACAVRAEAVWKEADAFTLPRFIVRNWDKRKFERKINTFK